jgi:hypothetical protein
LASRIVPAAATTDVAGSTTCTGLVITSLTRIAILLI